MTLYDLDSLDSALDFAEAVPYEDASWRNGALSDWTVIVGSGDTCRSFRVHKFALGIGERSSAFFYNHFNQPPEMLSRPATSRLEIGRALLCQCGVSKCQCTMAVQKQIAEVDRVLMLAFDDILEYIYEGTFEPAEHVLLPMWAVADYLQMDSLSARLSGLFNSIISPENAHRLLADCMRLKFGAEFVVPRCVKYIAGSFSSYTFEQLSVLGADIITAILQHPSLEIGGDASATIGAFLGRFLRLKKDMNQDQFVQFLSFLDADRYEVNAEDALFLVQRIRTYLQHANSATNRQILVALQARCFDSIAAGLDSLKPEDFSQVPLDMAIGVLKRDNLAVEDEDDVYALLRAYTAAHADLTPTQKADLWSTCRFAFLSAPIMLEASQRDDIPTDQVMRGAIMFKMLQDGHGGDGTSQMSKAMMAARPRLTPAFDDRFASATVTLSNKNRTARLAGPVGHSTVFSRQVVNVNTAPVKTFYWEFRLEGVRNVQGVYVGVAAAPSSQSQNQFHIGSSSLNSSWSMQASTGKKSHAGRAASYGIAVARGDVVGMALRCRGDGLASLTFYKNGKSMGEAYARVQGTVVPAVTLYRRDQQVTLTYKPNGCPRASKTSTPRGATVTSTSLAG